MKKNEKYLAQYKKVTALAQEAKKALIVIRKDSRKKTKRSNVKAKAALKSLAKMQNSIKDVDSFNALNEKLQETIPDFLPVTNSISKGCNLTISNYGALSVENGVTQMFTINDKPLEVLKVSTNSTGKITLYSYWFYRQDLSFDETVLESMAYGDHIKISEVIFTFRVDGEGNIDIYENAVKTLKNQIKEPQNLLFKVADLEANVINNKSFKVKGGIFENTDSVLPDDIKSIMEGLGKIGKRVTGMDAVEDGSKGLVSSFSVALELEKVLEKLVTQEVVFEKENQAVLSSDQRAVCVDWWKKLDSKLKTLIEDRKAKVKIIGFTSPPGSKEYNLRLGEDRAKHVAELLATFIGKNLKGECIADLRISSYGEEIGESKRYVRIIIEEK
ncbi:MAG: OmpA family protein [Aureispira sp.]|nr:OmpA family protein [Aureispira sp.]